MYLTVNIKFFIKKNINNNRVAVLLREQISL